MEDDEGFDTRHDDDERWQREEDAIRSARDAQRTMNRLTREMGIELPRQTDKVPF